MGSIFSASEPVPAPEQSRWLSEEVRPHEPALRHYLQAHFPSVEADDVVQESYLKLLRAGAAGRVASARSYFFTIARNTALTLFRRRKFYSDVPLSDLPEWNLLASERNAAELADLRQRFELAVEAVDQLPGRCREILQLALLQRIAPAEIARRLELSENTVYVQIARGMKRCRDYLKERGAQP
ncbi:MAG TPA: sigma-70 family RNA polymerase sigma factor [Opitutaceae bacterium]|nr:sigma-70 family RNA polymerase sigma factor [Opitutaceae bacterium]